MEVDGFRHFGNSICGDGPSFLRMCSGAIPLKGELAAGWILVTEILEIIKNGCIDGSIPPRTLADAVSKRISSSHRMGRF